MTFGAGRANWSRLRTVFRRFGQTQDQAADQGDGNLDADSIFRDPDEVLDSQVYLIQRKNNSICSAVCRDRQSPVPAIESFVTMRSILRCR